MNSGTRYHKSSEVVMGCRGANEKARDVDGEALPGGNPRTLSREERAETGWQPHRHVDQEGATRVDGVLRGATPLSAPATNRVGENVLFEEGQTLVLSGCDDRDEYLLKRDRIQEFVEHMGVALNQYSVFVLAFPSDSFLLEIAVTRKTRKKT